MYKNDSGQKVKMTMIIDYNFLGMYKIRKEEIKEHPMLMKNN